MLRIVGICLACSLALWFRRKSEPRLSVRCVEPPPPPPAAPPAPPAPAVVGPSYRGLLMRSHATYLYPFSQN